MKNLKILLLSLLAVILIVMAGYKYIYHIPGKNFMVMDARAVYVNENFSKKDMKPLEELLVKLGEDGRIEDLKREKKYIKNIYIIYFGNLELLDEHQVGVVDPGFLYPVLKSHLGRYFEKSGEYYLLKDKYRDKYSSGKEVFLKGYRGYFVFSDSKEKIEHVLSGIGKKNENILALEKRVESNIFGKIVLDASDTKAQFAGIEGSVFTGNYEGGKVSFNNMIAGEGGIIDLFSEQPKERKLEKYLDKNRIYISAADFGKAAKIFKNNMPGEQKILFDLWESFAGGSIEEFLGDIDGEIVGDIVKKQWIIPLRDTKRFKKFFKIFGKDGRVNMGSINLMLEGNTIFEGNGKISKGAGGRIADNQFLYGELTLDILDRKFSKESKVLIKGTAEVDHLNLNMELNEETLDEILSEMKN